ncbi:helix-turn-helix domain-containing protein [Bartonella sp. HY406]|uniref:helix-turn-helix domain-containing protein n=1 Tax=Bartonella sp. HY406 TaxID=2979331 RepID=UPI0021C9FB0E|nr:helix-turn-helix domain-containing protein [Bartonella sp. HY406]UXN05118.1 helix-turn-helix domain-containing protein [Bartonella sp. HY406]
MPTLTPSQAAKKIGVSRRTIMRAIERFELNASRNNKNQWTIKDDDLAQWARSGHAHIEYPPNAHVAHPNNSDNNLLLRIAVLETELAAERRRADTAETHIIEWKNQAEAWKEQAQNLLPKKKHWFWQSKK